MTDLTPNRFAEFFAAVNSGRSPFPWQQRLVNNLFEANGLWPSLLDLPTGSGKTSTVEIALYTLAAGLPVPRRIVFVVDRRVIVQQAAEHAKSIKRAIEVADTGVLRELHTGLIALQAPTQSGSGPRVPFEVAELRGATTADTEWAKCVDVPAVLASTVDQVGSRLLYRGYGVSDRMKPIHAGLLGNDALLLLDEVHLARPFAELLATIKARFRPCGIGIPDRWQVVELSATPAIESAINPEDKFSIDADDLSDPVLGRRLRVAKRASTLEVTLPADPERQIPVLAKAHVAQALSLIATPGVTTIGVVVNRVRLAAEIARRLAGQADRVILVTGRMRGIDRDTAVTEMLGSAGTGTRRPGTTIVVATQTIEAGADLDFDAIVSDCASFDALVQRFGRVDRLGELHDRLDGGEPPSSVIVGSRRLVGSSDPIYGKAVGDTWKWLTAQQTLDMGPSALAELRASEYLTPAFEGTLTVASPESMRLLRSHLDRLVRTSPIPDADVPVDRLLHGLYHEPDPEVEVVWRADVTMSMLLGSGIVAGAGAYTDRDITELIELLPPVRGEAMSVPLNHLRNWLNTSETVSDDLALSDVESAESSIVGTRGRIRPCIIVRAGSILITARGSELRPGDTVIVPADYGGISNRTWSPSDRAPVTDVCELAGMEAGVFRIRLHPAIVEPAASEGHIKQARQGAEGKRAERELLRSPQGSGSRAADDSSIPTPAWVEANDLKPIDEVRGWLKTRWRPRALTQLAQGSPEFEQWQRWRQAVPKDLRAAELHTSTSEFLTGTEQKEPMRVYIATRRLDSTTVPATTGRGSTGGGQYPLARHLDDVAHWARVTAHAVGADDELAEQVADAAQLHDSGKADPRFQDWMNEGRIDTTELVAKSAIPVFDHTRNARARQRAGYPEGLRHEVASVALLPESSPLVTRYLVATHHGYGRPLFRPQVSPPIDIEFDGVFVGDPYVEASLGSGRAEDFAQMIDAFGYFGVGWLEAILRLADHRASAEIVTSTKGVKK